ncbi:ExbD/TolR family protein [Arcticibacter eurypsychrophilus]|uniref:ExbD/TolR family protein n=1 Tax=Arcticibacter eurypsychrophilus TaxID=1434752 RepID=UPI00084D2796|nr:biopolymer transporter ExbD [Arcticibacter eurypsychrophilus]
MAELDSGGGGNHKGGKVRSKKQSTRVDMTPMVDLMFLLITFFMLTTTLAKPQAMDLAMPDKDDVNPNEQLDVADTRTMTVLLGNANRIEWFIGIAGNSLTPPTVENFGKNGIRKTIIGKAKDIKAATGKDMIIIIKPSDKSNYKNLVDILDEMKITNTKQYAIVDISAPEVDLLKRDKIY